MNMDMQYVISAWIAGIQAPWTARFWGVFALDTGMAEII